jgi:hypothetical protein
MFSFGKIHHQVMNLLRTYQTRTSVISNYVSIGFQLLIILHKSAFFSFIVNSKADSTHSSEAIIKEKFDNVSLY